MVVRKEKGNFSPFPSSWTLPSSGGNQTIWEKRRLAFPWAVNIAMLGQSEGVTLKPGRTVYPRESFSSSDTNTSQQNHKGRVREGREAAILPFNSSITIRMWRYQAFCTPPETLPWHKHLPSLSLCPLVMRKLESSWQGKRLSLLSFGYDVAGAHPGSVEAQGDEGKAHRLERKSWIKMAKENNWEKKNKVKINLLIF